MRIRRLGTVAAGTLTVLALGAGPASAHFCYFNDANPNAQDGRAGSKAFVAFGTLAEHHLGLCPEGIEFLADAVGVQPTTLINGHGVMAGPTGGNKPIGHLDFEALFAAVPEAHEVCGTEWDGDL